MTSERTIGVAQARGRLLRGRLALLGATCALVAAGCAEPAEQPAAVADSGGVDAADVWRAPDSADDQRQHQEAAGRDRGGDGQAAESLRITINELPEAMSGSLPFTNAAGQLQTFRWTVPRHGFSVDVFWTGSEGPPADLLISADVTLGEGAEAIAAGTDLSSLFSFKDASAHYQVKAAQALPVGSATFSVQGGAGASAVSGSITVAVAERTYLLDPFRQPDPWLIYFGQDNYTIEQTLAGGRLGVAASAQPNGLADFAEDLQLVGLGSTAMTPAAASLQSRGVQGTNAIVIAWIKAEILATLRQVFHQHQDGGLGAGAVPVQLFLDSDPAAPDPSQYVHQQIIGGEPEKQFSIMAVGGGDLALPFLGYSKTLDHNNRQNEDNLGPAYGVFTTSAIAMLFELGATEPTIETVLQALLGDFVPAMGVGGTPVGEHPFDPQILADDFDPQQAAAAAALRYQRLSFVVESLGRLTAALVAHEMGHSLGLVANGPPPQGLFGGEHKAEFVSGARTTSLHIDTEGFNLMEAGPGTAPMATLDMLQYLTPPSFNPINVAYLRGRVLLMP